MATTLFRQHIINNVKYVRTMSSQNKPFVIQLVLATPNYRFNNDGETHKLECRESNNIEYNPLTKKLKIICYGDITLDSDNNTIYFKESNNDNMFLN